jgi:hypothetical protein
MVSSNKRGGETIDEKPNSTNDAFTGRTTKTLVFGE